MTLGSRLLLCVLIALQLASAQATLSTSAGPTPLRLAVPLDGPASALASFVVAAVNPDRSQAQVKFKFDHLEAVPTASPLLITYPANGTTPATIYIGVNPSVLTQADPGLFHFTVYFTTVDQSPVSQARALVDVAVGFPAAPIVRNVVNSSSYQPQIAPGAIISIFGDNLAPPRGATEADSAGVFPSVLSGVVFLRPMGAASPNTTVTINDIAAPLLYVSPGQINAQVPYGVAADKTASLTVKRYGQASVPFIVSVADTSPGIFTATQDGTGQGAILNVPPNSNDPTAYSYNNSSNPAQEGQAIEFFATGTGIWNLPVSNGIVGPPVVDGQLSLVAANFTHQPVSLTIGGKTSRIYYAGSAPYQVWGTMQVVAFIPQGVGTGPQPLVLKVGDNDNAKQKVTVAVK